MSQPEPDEVRFLAAFHAGDRATLEVVYEEHFDTVDYAVAHLLNGSDRETIVQDVFLRLVASDALRRNFQGGNLSAWLRTVARNQAIDFLRRHGREVPLERPDGSPRAERSDEGRFAEWSDAKILVERFQKEVLPPKWARVFQARFLDQLSQREAAVELSMSRTTLAYQELRIHGLLKKFLLASEKKG